MLYLNEVYLIVLWTMLHCTEVYIGNTTRFASIYIEQVDKPLMYYRVSESNVSRGSSALRASNHRECAARHFSQGGSSLRSSFELVLGVEWLLYMSRSSVWIEGIIDASRLDSLVYVVIHGYVIVCNWSCWVETNESHLRGVNVICDVLYWRRLMPLS